MINFKQLMKYRWQALVVSLIIILIGFGGVLYRGGLLYGIEFTGGFQMMYEFNQPVTAERLADLREEFDRQAFDANLTSFSVEGESPMRGLMITARTQDAVEALTERLYQAGQAGNEEVFDQLSEDPELSFVREQSLREEFHFGDGGGLNLTEANRDGVRQNVQTIMNRTLNRVIEDLLQEQFTDQEPEVDLNTASTEELRRWIREAQVDSFLEQLEERVPDAGSVQELEDLLSEFEIALSDFAEVFSVGDEPGRIDLTEASSDNLREIVVEEFFQDQYESEAEQLSDLRERVGVFQNVEQVLDQDLFSDLDRDRLASTAGVSPFRMLQGEMISPAIGSELIVLALTAVLISMIGVLIYLYIRFELFYSVGAVVAIVHDVIITVGLITLIGIEFNVPVVAAILTVIGYSLNDTIVNFDRVRENRTLMGFRPSWMEVINRSVYEVLPRTYATSFTTFLAVLVLYLFGGIALYGFSVALIIGVVIGTWSSIFISNAALLWLQERFGT